MEEPVLSLNFALRAPDMPFGRWAASGDHHIWHARFPLDHPPLEVWEWRDAGIVRLPIADNALNMIPAGTPYHIEHLFGFWRLSAADTNWVRSVQEDGVYHVMLIGGLDGADVAEETVWFCPGCGGALVRHRHAKGGDPESYWRTQLDHVRAFNADAASRTCTSCGTVHPAVHGFDPAADSSDEARARRAGWMDV